MPHRPDHNRYVSSSSLEESGNLRSSSLRTPFARAQSSRKLVQAGDLMGTISESSRPYARGGLNTPRVPRSGTHMPHAASKAPRLQEEDEFDLRDEVMTCIAKSIGLQQPPLSGGNSVEASPAVGATMMPDRSRSGQHPSPFGSLSSLMGLGDDMSTMTGASSVTGVADLSGLDNEVEILFFAAGSTLARAGERNTGLFYVIEASLAFFVWNLLSRDG
jgi:lysophospholipid hydrolase